jgi:hypothetical protein
LLPAAPSLWLPLSALLPSPPLTLPSLQSPPVTTLTPLLLVLLLVVSVPVLTAPLLPESAAAFSSFIHDPQGCWSLRDATISGDSPVHTGGGTWERCGMQGKVRPLLDQLSGTVLLLL